MRLFEVEVEGRIGDRYTTYSVQVIAASGEDAIRNAGEVVTADLGAGAVIVQADVLPPDPDNPKTMPPPVRAYIARIQELTKDVPFAERFSMDLPDPDPALTEGVYAGCFREALLAQHQRWRDELTNAEWQDVVRRNPGHPLIGDIA